MGERLALGRNSVGVGEAGRPGSAMSSTGTTISRSSSLVLPASTISHSRFGPTRNLAIRSSGRCVADKPDPLDTNRRLLGFAMHRRLLSSLPLPSAMRVALATWAA